MFYKSNNMPTHDVPSGPVGARTLRAEQPATKWRHPFECLLVCMSIRSPGRAAVGPLRTPAPRPPSTAVVNHSTGRLPLLQVRRVQSLSSLADSRPSTVDDRRSRRPSRIPPRKDVRAASTDRCAPDEHREGTPTETDQHGANFQEFSTLSRLKDNVSKLRAHLMGVRYPRRLPVGTMSDTSGDEAHYRRSRKFVMAATTGSTKDCTNYHACNGYDSEGENSDNGSVKCSIQRHVINQRGHGDGPARVVQQPTNHAGRRRTYYRARARNGDSEEQHHVRMNYLQKSQSLMELKAASTPPAQGVRRRPVRTKSASSTRSASSQPAAHSDDGFDDNFEREQPNATDTANRSRRSLDAGLDSSSWPNTVSRSSSSISVSSSRSKGKRTLPKVPSVGGSELEERKKRISSQVLKRAQRKVQSLAEKHLSPEQCGKQRVAGSGEDHIVGGNHCSNQNSRHRHCDTVGDVYCNETRYTNSNGSHSFSRNNEYVSYGPASQRPDEYPVHTVDVTKLTGGCSDDTDDETADRGQPPQQLRRVNGLLQLHLQQDGYVNDKTCMRETATDRNGYCQSSSIHRLGERTSASADALQRIIRDLRDASTKPIEKRRVSCPAESSDEFSSSSSPSSSSLSSERQVADDQLFTPISQDQDVVDDNDNIADGIGRYLEMSQSITSSLQKRKLHGMSAQDGGNDKNVRNEVSLSHPPLHRILKSCDLITVALENKRGHDVGEYGIELFESAYCDTCPEVTRTARAEDAASFRSPEGRRPVIGRTRGAFLPVSSTTDGSGGGTILSLVAIDRIVHNSVARCNGSLREGDYVIEVNGAYVVPSPIDEVRRHLSNNQDTLHLVVARLRLTQCLANPVAGKIKHMQDKEDVNVDVRKELEKMKLKYTTLRQTTEKNMDTIAELQLELKEKQARIWQLEEELREKHEQAHMHEQQHAAKDEKIMHWRREANQRSVEIARLKFDARQKEDRIAQLRKLLIQQTELMHLQGFNSGSVSDAEYEEHISEV